MVWKRHGEEFGRKLVAVIGDSTFIHSGITGLIDVIYNQGNSTVVILDNSTTGMTGHQDHPGTGRTIKRQGCTTSGSGKTYRGYRCKTYKCG